MTVVDAAIIRNVAGKALAKAGVPAAHANEQLDLLLEAELEPENWGATLGQLGSRLIIETVNGALREDPNSYLSRFGAGWEPPPWTISRMQVKKLADLARLVGLYE